MALTCCVAGGEKVGGCETVRHAAVGVGIERVSSSELNWQNKGEHKNK